MSTTDTEPDATTEEPQAAPPEDEQPADDTPEPERPTMSPVEALEAEGGTSGRGVALTTPAGSLTLRPNQTELDSVQRAALVAIGIDTKSDPGVIPHARAFVHMCQIRGLDPFAREAYLIGRGRGEKRKWTMQTGIDGYRKMGAATGRFIRVKKVLWTGSNDDDLSYVREKDDDGDYVMKRVWWDQWPANRGNPGAAKVTIEHYTEDEGSITTTSAVADWGMYAPYNDQWEDKPGGGRRVKRDRDGKVVQELSDMWVKGGPHMLAKCLPGNTRIQILDGGGRFGSLTIREIVRGRLPVKVRSINLDTGEECWQSVVNWWRNDVTSEWVTIRSINGGRGNRAVRTTPDHPFWTPAGWREAGDLSRGDMVAVASPTLSREQEQVLRGSMLGDGSLQGDNRSEASLPHFAESHSIAQADYLRWKAEALSNLSPTVTEYEATDGAGGRHPAIAMRTRAVPVLHDWRRKPQEWLDGLDDLGLAVWFMDDGAIKGTKPKTGYRPLAALHCCGFPVEFADAAVGWFAARGITCKVQRRDKNPYLTFGADATAILLDRLTPYLRRDGNRKVWKAAPLVEQGLQSGYVFAPVLEVNRAVSRKPERRYDIEVEGTHTFVVNNMVVSNCAEALAYRKAFPAKMSGVYITEEMHRADADERDRQRVERSRQRREAYETAQREQSAARGEGSQVSEQPGEGEGPTTLATDVAERVAEVKPDEPVEAVVVEDESALDWLRAEFVYQAETLGQSPDALAKRVVAKHRTNLEDFGIEQMLPMVVGFRPMVVSALTSKGDADPVDTAYRDAAADSERPIDWDALVGHEPDADPDALHRFVASEGGGCWTCGLPEDVGPHPVGDDDRADESGAGE